jgi:capsular exopolysaccharide synthesis family protein
MEPVALRFDARDYLRVFLKRKWFITVIAIAAMLLGGVYGVLAPKQYRASALILVREQPKGVFWITGSNPRPDDTVEVALETQAAIATSIDTAERTAKRLHSREGVARLNAEPTDIVGSLHATVMPPDRIRIEASHINKDRAIAYAGETAVTFCETSGDIRRSDESRARAFLEQQLEKTRDDILELARHANQFAGVTGFLSPVSSIEKLQDVLNGYRNQLAVAEGEGAAAERDLTAIRQQMDTAQPFYKQSLPTVNPTVDGLRKELASNEIALTELRARYTEDHPAITDAKARISQIQDEIKAQPAYVEMPTVMASTALDQLRTRLQDAQSRLATAQGRVAVLRGTVARAEAQLAYVASRQFQLTQYQDAMELAKATEKRMVEDLQTKRLSEAMKQGNAIIIDHPVDATVTGAPVGRSLLFGGVLGLFAGLVLALALEMLDDTIRTPEDLTRETQVAFLGLVPMLDTGTPELITIAAPKSPPAEAYRTLRSNINFSLIDEPAKTFLVTSAGAGEGKSVTAANLAVVFAQSGQSVILVDADLRRATQHKFFSREATRGVTNVLVGDMPVEDALQDTDVDGLRLLASGPLPPNPAELLDSRRMTDLIKRLADMADTVIFDSPPAVVVSDAAIISSKIDRTILVAETGQVTRSAFAEMVRLIQHARGRILGGILNKQRLSSGDYYYYYYYYDYASDRPGPRESAPSR